MIRLFQIFSILFVFMACNADFIQKEDENSGHDIETVAESYRANLSPSIVVQGLEEGDSLLLEVEGREVSPQFIVKNTYFHPDERDDVGCWGWMRSYEGTSEKVIHPKDALKDLRLKIYDREYPLNSLVKVELGTKGNYVFKLNFTKDLLQGESHFEIYPSPFDETETVALGPIGIEGGCKWREILERNNLLKKYTEIFQKERKYHVSYKVLREI